MKTMKQIVEFLKVNGACKESRTWLSNYADPLVALEKCEDEIWIAWLGNEIGSPALKKYQAIASQLREKYIVPLKPDTWGYFTAIDHAWETAQPLVKQDIRNWILEA